MPSLDTMIQDLAARGELTYLSLAPVAGKGGDKGVVFAAVYSSASKWGHGMARDADPVEALKKAIADVRLPKVKRKLEEAIAAAPVEHEKEPWE